MSASTGEYAKRYGFIYVRRHDDGTGDFARLRKKSFFWYKKVIASNGEDLEAVIPTRPIPRQTDKPQVYTA